MALNDIVEVNITRQTTSVAVAAFNVPLILSQFATNKTNPAFSRARVYGSLAELYADGWRSTDAVYNMAQTIFSQNPSVNKIVVGRKDSNDATIDAALNAIANENNDWYGIVVDQSLVSSFADVASWVETAKKFAIFWITDVNAYDPSKSTDLASVLKLANRNRSAVVWHATPAGGADYPDAAWMGEGFPYEPGTSTWAYKTLNGVTPDTLLASQETALKAKNCNYYMTVGGVSITQEGKVASGEYIDIIIGTDWIEARLREAVYSALVNNRKIPYDDTGIAMIEGLVKGVLNEAASKGILQADSIAVTVPKYADIPQADKLARKLPDVKFSALYQGAIHSVTINGTISV